MLMNHPATIHAAAELIRSGQLSPTELLEQCFQQIDRYEEKVRAWVFVAHEDARQQAEELTQELKRGNYRGPLHGIPIGVKDIIDVREWPTAAGSKRWANAIAREDAEVVAKLRTAGAVFVGKTVTTAFASFDPAITRNPWDLSKTPGGSSSGSAAAVACGMCLGALATQTGGSITRPAAYCGVSSFKSEFAMISLKGVVPLAESMDHMGVMANDAQDLALLIDPILYCSEERPVVPIHSNSNTTQIGRFCGLFEERMDSEMRPAYEKLLTRLREAGIAISERPLPTGFSTVTEDHAVIMAVEAAQFHEHRFKKYPEDYPPRISSLIQTGLTTPAARYARAKRNQFDVQVIRDSFGEFATAITPATIGAAVDASTTGEPLFNSPWSFVGLPTISLPFAWTDSGLPLSIQLVAPLNNLRGLFQDAAILEKIINFQRREVMFKQGNKECEAG